MHTSLFGPLPWRLTWSRISSIQSTYFLTSHEYPSVNKFNKSHKHKNLRYWIIRSVFTLLFFLWNVITGIYISFCISKHTFGRLNVIFTYYSRIILLKIWKFLKTNVQINFFHETVFKLGFITCGFHTNVLLYLHHWITS